MVEREIRYNFMFDTAEQSNQRFRWTVAVVNEPREIKRIKQRFFEQLAPVNDILLNYQLQIKNSGGIYCEVFSFSTDNGNILQPDKIYKSKKFRRDRDLRERDDIGLERYVMRLLK